MADGGEWVSYHEAGHAVVAWWVGYWFEWVSVPLRQLYVPEDKPAVFMRSELDECIMVNCAGTVAEEVFSAGRELPTESKDAAAHEQALALELAERRHEHPPGAGEIDPRDGLAPPEGFQALRSLTHNLVCHLWPAVEAVARELVQKERLSYAEVTAILEALGLVRRTPRDLGPWFPRKPP
jgi:hypothetical protein